MHKQTHIEFQGMKATPELRTTIDQHVVELEKRFDRLTVARIAVRGADCSSPKRRPVSRKHSARSA
jgi:hypothetical protein